MIKKVRAPHGPATKAPAIMENIIDGKKSNAAHVTMWQPALPHVAMDPAPATLPGSGDSGWVRTQRGRGSRER